MTMRNVPMVGGITGFGHYENGVAVCSCGFRYPTSPPEKWTADEGKAMVKHQQLHSPTRAVGEQTRGEK